MIKFFLSAYLFFISASVFAQHDMNMPGMKMDKPAPGAKKKNSKTQTYYTCSMHPQVRKDKPGSCPICGMTLIKKTIKVSPEKAVPKKQVQMQKNTMTMHPMDHDQMQQNKM